jgi:hypothetical protein
MAFSMVWAVSVWSPTKSGAESERSTVAPGSVRPPITSHEISVDVSNVPTSVTASSVPPGTAT